ncbi:MAG: hypothetical protein WCL53_10010 [Chloroflexota bacterium]
MDVQRLRAAVPRSIPTWAWRICRFVGLAVACGLGVLAGAALVALQILGWMNMGWALVIALAVLTLAVTAGRQLSVTASRRRQSEDRAAIAAIPAVGE